MKITRQLTNKLRHVLRAATFAIISLNFAGCVSVAPPQNSEGLAMSEEPKYLIYDELEKHGNPGWAGVEANAGFPGSVMDWETYLAWHYNHGCVLVGINMGATGSDLPKRLNASAFGEEALAAYHKFLRGQLLMEKAVSVDHPQFRIQAKMKRVRAGIQRWHSSGKDPSAVGELMQGIQPLMIGGKLNELEKVLDQALEMLGETEAAPDGYGQD